MVFAFFETNYSNIKCSILFSSYFFCNKGGSDGSLSGTDGEEQELWEETQIGKGVKRRPGEQVADCTKQRFLFFLPSLVLIILFFLFVKPPSCV